MITDLFNKFHRMVTLRFSILSIFVSLFLIAMLSLIYINFRQSSSMLLFTANNIMTRVSNSVDQEFTQEIKKAENDSTLSTHLIHQGLIDPSNQAEMIGYTLDLAYQFYLVQSVRWADVLGNYIKAEYNTDTTIMTEVFENADTSPRIKHIYRDEQLNVIKQETLGTPSFDPRQRPWYIHAVAAKKSVWTQIYNFQPSDLSGVSLTTPIYSNTGVLRGVLCLDIGLDWLSWYLGEQKITPDAILFIVTRDGQVIAHSKKYDRKKPFKILGINKLDTPWIAQSFSIYNETHKTSFDFTYKGKEYLATYKKIPQFEMHGWTIGIVIPKNDFIAKLKETSLMNTLLSLIILCFGILFVSSLVTRLVKPIKDLVIETEKIRHFNLHSKVRVISSITEIMALSNAVHAMKIGLQSFNKYIPATLVRQLIEAGENARIGGTKKPLVVLFSDIVNFTKISENMDPNLLMVHICEYFDELSKIIVKQKGTIDKYIGDSIMAFWGAPLPVSAPSVKAARAALQCKKRLMVLNEKWKAQNKPAFETRFGIHIGDAIVGNVGSSERLNYTALGDSINVASRFEGINKIYGTTIIVSDSLHQKIKNHFILRKVDHVAVKGKTISYIIYELMAENKNEIHFDIDAYKENFDTAFNAYAASQWDQAIGLFQTCLTIFSEDTVASVFIVRCQDFKLHPPSSEWDGVWHYIL